MSVVSLHVHVPAFAREQLPQFLLRQHAVSQIEIYLCFYNLFSNLTASYSGRVYGSIGIASGCMQLRMLAAKQCLETHLVSQRARTHQRYAMQAQASKLAKDAEPADNRFKGFDEFMAAAKADAAAKAVPVEAADVGTSNQASQELPYSPGRSMSSDDEDAGLPDLTNLIGSSSRLDSKQVGNAACAGLLGSVCPS